jgi:hypothetical protein
MPFQTDAHRLDSSVNDFQKVFKGNPNLYEDGQFVLSVAYYWQVHDVLETEVSDARRLGKLTPDFEVAFRARAFDPWNPAKIPPVFRALNKSKALAAALPLTFVVFRPDPDGGDDWARREFQSVWSGDGIPAPYILEWAPRQRWQVRGSSRRICVIERLRRWLCDTYRTT